MCLPMVTDARVNIIVAPLSFLRSRSLKSSGRTLGHNSPMPALPLSNATPLGLSMTEAGPGSLSGTLDIRQSGAGCDCATASAARPSKMRRQMRVAAGCPKMGHLSGNHWSGFRSPDRNLNPEMTGHIWTYIKFPHVCVCVCVGCLLVW